MVHPFCICIRPTDALTLGLTVGQQQASRSRVREHPNTRILRIGPPAHIDPPAHPPAMGFVTVSKSEEKKPLINGADYGSTVPSALHAGLGDRYPSQNATCVSAALFSWVNPVMELGNARPL